MNVHQIKYLLFALFICIPFQYSNAYDYSVGIPSATINFEQEAPTRPSDWTEEVNGYYYIDYTNGSDVLTFGSEQHPRKTLPKTLTAGSYVEISGEYSYTSGGVIKVFATGTDTTWVANKSGPVWITSAQNNPGSFINAKTVVWGNNIYLTNMTIEKNSKIQVGSTSTGYAANNIVIKDNTFIGTLEMGNGALLSVLGADTTPSKNIVLFNNLLKDAGDITNEKDVDAGLIVISGYSSYVWALKNVGYNASGSALQINASPPRDASHNIYAGKNEFYNVRQSGLWVKYATNVVFSSNYVHDIISTPWSPAKGLGGQYEPNGLWIINNRIHDVEYGVRIPSTNAIDQLSLKVYVIGNVIYDVHTEAAVGTNSSWESAGIHIQGANERFIYNNLIYNTPNGINVSSTSGNTSIKNNVILKVNNSHPLNQQGFHIWSEHHESQPEISISNNFFGSDEMRVKLKNTEFSTVSSLDDYLNSMTNQEFSIDFSGLLDISQSGITNILANGFNENLLWDHGKNIFPELSNALIAATDSNVALNVDILNNPRIDGLSVDIGPFEKKGENPDVSLTTKPAKPANITINIK